MADESEKGTLYVILRQVSDGDAFEEIGVARAGNDDAAINLFLENGDNAELYGEGEYRAVPKRSWPDEPRSKRKKISFR